jgi:hypothetical protein
MAQKTLEETYHATRTTDFNEGFWNKFLGELGARFRALETIKIDWEVVSQEGIQVALDRINEVLGPAAERVQNIASLGFLSVESHSERTLEVGLVNFVAVQGDQLDLFVPTPFVAVTRVANPLDYALGQVTFFDRETGSMDIQISYFDGDPGPHSDWVISAVAGQAIAQNSLLNQTLAARDIAVGARQDVEADREEVAENTASVFELYGDFRDAMAPSGPVAPADPKPRQLWFDGAVLRVWNGAAFTPVAVAASDYYLKSEVDNALATKLAAATYTAADVLAKIKTVDGAGSGLDADTLDGISSAGFMAAGSRAKPLRSDGTAIDVVWTGQGPLTYVLSSNDGVLFYPVASSYFYKTTDIVTGDIATFPIGTYLLVITSTNPGIGRGGGYNLATNNNIQGGYSLNTTAGAVTGLAGAWVSRGSVVGASNNYYYLMQRYG